MIEKIRTLTAAALASNDADDVLDMLIDITRCAAEPGFSDFDDMQEAIRSALAVDAHLQKIDPGYRQ